ncbi:carboxylesterase/lipase family protein [Acrocarpospora macrocephala]|uniref:carboxylesterase/lipase family protein n=1 Tax=Acrocarpospora macrocephala TaxID=150177 RepID=UPI0012D2E430|nr:carboxylesterase family protein [Acrocarpospora macrocephala]
MRLLKASILLSVVAGWLLMAAPAEASTGIVSTGVVRTDAGAVRGTVAADHRTFQGIPFAAPPVGALRWRAPQPVEPWRGVRDATRPGPRCAQNAAIGSPAGDSEDCLYLNVTTPRPLHGLRPVMVWVHGGGFSGGAGSDYDERRLAVQGDVVVVTVNYRLGAFGFFGYPGLKDSGTYGLMDQQAALRWVRRNAAAFGGDPGRVTLFGESAGGDSMCAQLASPAAAGLFQRMVIQSGSCTELNVPDVIFPGVGAEYDTWKPREVLEGVGARVAPALGCADPATAMECLRGLPVSALLAAQNPPVFWSPAYGTATLPVHPGRALREGKFNRVPVLAGTTRDEGAFFAATFPPLAENDYRGLLSVAFGDKADLVAERYPAGTSPRGAWGSIITDRGYACPNRRNDLVLARWTPVYGYEFADRDAPLPFEFPRPEDFPLGAFHASELAYLHDFKVTFRPDQQRLSDTMIRYWTRFAAVGRPAASWPAVPLVQSLEPGGNRPADLNERHNCDFWDSLG